MSVDVLPPNTGHIAGYNHLSVNDTRPRHIDSRTRRKLADPNNRVNMVHFDPNYIIYDSGTDTTYLRGRLLGKVCRCSIFYILDITTSTPTPPPPPICTPYSVYSRISSPIYKVLPISIPHSIYFSQDVSPFRISPICIFTQILYPPLFIYVFQYVSTVYSQTCI